MDGHSTHSKNLEALNYAREHNIHLLQLPGHTTHRLQPLDVAFFKPLQSYCVHAQEKWLRANVGKTISEYHVASLFSEAYGRAATVKTAASAFRGSGIWPVDRNHFKDHDFTPWKTLCPNQEQLDDGNEPLQIDEVENEATVSSTRCNEQQPEHESELQVLDISEIELITISTNLTSGGPSCVLSTEAITAAPNQPNAYVLNS
jgi:hypothetical protein